MTEQSGVYQIVCKHFLQVPCTCFDLSLTLFETSNLQKTKNKTTTKTPKSQKPYFTSIYYYSLLTPINPLWGSLVTPINPY